MVLASWSPCVLQSNKCFRSQRQTLEVGTVTALNPQQGSSLLKTPLYYSWGQPAMVRAGDVVQGSAQLQLGGRSHHGHDQAGTTSGFSLQPTTHLGFLTALGSRNYAHFVFSAIATNTMHKGYYIFVHPLKTPDSLLSTLLPALPS